MLIDVLESLSPHFDISFIQKNLELLINSLILFLIKENKIGSFEVNLLKNLGVYIKKMLKEIF